MDLDAFDERAAIMEFDGGLSRFDAETQAAKAQGKTRWEAINAIKLRNLAAGRDHGSQAVGNAAGNLPGVQRNATKQNGSMPERDVQAGRDRLELLALRP